MSDKGGADVRNIVDAAMGKGRGYADFFGWPPDRNLEELSVVEFLVDSMARHGSPQFCCAKSRGRGNDPPDVEAIDSTGARIAIEVTELVDGQAIRASKQGRAVDWTPWDQRKFLARLQELISAKDEKYVQLKDGPYDGGYVVIVFTDEPMLPRRTVEEYLRASRLTRPTHIRDVFLLLSYDPAVASCPYYPLWFGA